MESTQGRSLIYFTLLLLLISFYAGDCFGDTVTITGLNAPVDGSQYTASGGTAPYTWCISKGSITQAGVVTVSGQCGTATVMVSDACGQTGSLRVKMQNGTWVNATDPTPMYTQDPTQFLPNNTWVEFNGGYRYMRPTSPVGAGAFLPHVFKDYQCGADYEGDGWHGWQYNQPLGQYETGCGGTPGGGVYLQCGDHKFRSGSIMGYGGNYGCSTLSVFGNNAAWYTYTDGNIYGMTEVALKQNYNQHTCRLQEWRCTDGSNGSETTCTPSPCYLTITVFNSSNKTIKPGESVTFSGNMSMSTDWAMTIADRTFSGTGTSASATWDGKDSTGNYAAPGNYTATLTARNCNGSCSGTKTADVEVQCDLASISATPQTIDPSSGGHTLIVGGVITTSPMLLCGLTIAGITVDCAGSSASLTWDGRDSSGKIVAPGIYPASFGFTTTAGCGASKSVDIKVIEGPKACSLKGPVN